MATEDGKENHCRRVSGKQEARIMEGSSFFDHHFVTMHFMAGFLGRQIGDHRNRWYQTWLKKGKGGWYRNSNEEQGKHLLHLQALWIRGVREKCCPSKRNNIRHHHVVIKHEYEAKFHRRVRILFFARYWLCSIRHTERVSGVFSFNFPHEFLPDIPFEC